MLNTVFQKPYKFSSYFNRSQLQYLWSIRYRNQIGQYKKICQKVAKITYGLPSFGAEQSLAALFPADEANTVIIA